MSRPYMPLYVADYLKDTMHLSATEHGAYLLLIMAYWAAGSLPDDDEKLARICRASPKEWQKLKPVVRPFFGPGWSHKRIDAELATLADKTERRQIAGKRGGEAKARNRASNATILLDENPSKTLPSIRTRTRVEDNPQHPSPTTRGAAPADAPSPPPPNPDAERNRFTEIEHRCRQALGSAAPADPDISPIVGLVDQGAPIASLERIFRGLASRRRARPIRTWRLWAQLATEAMADEPTVPISIARPPDDPADPMVRVGMYRRKTSFVRQHLLDWSRGGAWVFQWLPEGDLSEIDPAAVPDALREVAA